MSGATAVALAGLVALAAGVVAFERRPLDIRALALVATLGALAASWGWAQHAARAAVRAHLREAPRDLASDPGLARELGELFGVASRPDDSVATFVERLERALDLPPRKAAPRAQAAFEFDDAE